MGRPMLVALLLLATGCAATPEAPGPGEGPEGALLATSDGTSIWYRVAGDRDAPAVLYLHGGPGYNCYDFERAAGPLLERRLRMVYLDQRGCGRSPGTAETRLGTPPTVEDIDALRQGLGIGRLTLIGHSFGGLLALEYARLHPDRVDGLVLVDTTADLPVAFGHQAEVLERLAPAAAAAAGPAPSARPALERLLAAYRIVGPEVAQRRLLFASDEGWARHEAWDEASGLRGRGVGVMLAYAEEGCLDSSHPELMRTLGTRGVLLAGLRSGAVGVEGIEAAARAWGVPVRWFERSGHFVYADEPEAFAAAVVEFVEGR